MKILQNLNKVRQNPLYAYNLATGKGLTKFVPDEVHLRIKYRCAFGKPLNLESPVTFNEKLQWLKLHDRNPLYTTLVDKYRVKEWVTSKIGLEYVTPTYASWPDVDSIDISTLPNRFVLKTNHDCGGIAICSNRDTFNLENARTDLRKHLRRNYYWGCREWPYKYVDRLVFAEEYIDPLSHEYNSLRASRVDNTELTDYKFYCFNGEPQFLYVSRGMTDHTRATMSFLNLDWSFAPFARTDYAPLDELPPRPRCYDELLSLTRKLAEGIPFVRVDFFVYDGRPRFSEMTFSPCGGFMPFDPPEWDARIGKLLEIPC